MCLSVSLSVCLCVCLPVCLCVCVSLSLPACLSFWSVFHWICLYVLSRELNTLKQLLPLFVWIFLYIPVCILRSQWIFCAEQIFTLNVVYGDVYDVSEGAEIYVELTLLRWTQTFLRWTNVFTLSVVYGDVYDVSEGAEIVVTINYDRVRFTMKGAVRAENRTFRFTIERWKQNAAYNVFYLR